MKHLTRTLCAFSAAALLCAALSGCSASDRVKDKIDSEAEKKTADVMHNHAGLDTDAQFVYNAFRTAATDMQLSAPDIDCTAAAGVHILTPADFNVTADSPDNAFQALLYRVHQQNENLAAKKSQIAVKLDSNGFVLAAAVTDGTIYGTYPNASEDAAFDSIEAALSHAEQ